MVGKKKSSKAHQLRGELYKELVLEAAEQEFAEHGFENARVQRISEATGLSTGSIYKLYASKQVLYMTVHRTRAGELVQAVLSSLGPDGDAFVRLGRGIHAQVALSAQHPAYLRMLLRYGHSWASLPRDLPPQATQLWKSAIGTSVDICKAGIASGLLIADDPLRMVRTMAVVHQAQLVHWMDGDFAESPADVAARSLDCLARLYRRRSA